MPWRAVQRPFIADLARIGSTVAATLVLARRAAVIAGENIAVIALLPFVLDQVSARSDDADILHRGAVLADGAHPPRRARLRLRLGAAWCARKSTRCN